MIKNLLLGALACAIAIPCHAATHIWTGAASTIFSDDANWVGGSPGSDAEADLSFPAGSPVSVQNDLTGLQVRSMMFSSTGYTIGGNAITLVQGAQLLDSSTGPNTISCDLVIPYELTVQPLVWSDFTLSGAISGSGGLTVRGGTVILAGTTANRYTGTTRVLTGELQLHKSANTAAFSGPLVIERVGSAYGGYVSTLADEQIPDTVDVTLGYGGSMGLGATETLGAFTMARGSSISTAAYGLPPGRLILGGDVKIVSGSDTGSNYLSPDEFLPASRTIRMPETGTFFRINNLSGAPGAGLTFIGADDGFFHAKAEVYGSYNGPTVVEGGTLYLKDSASPVTVHGGSFSGTAASVTVEGTNPVTIGWINAGSLKLTSSVTADLHVYFTDDPAPIQVSTAPELAGAKLSFHFDGSDPIGWVQTVIANNSALPISGTFAGLPEGAIIDGRWRVSYRGGDGNDMTVTDLRRLAAYITLSANPSPVVVGNPTTISAQVGSSYYPPVSTIPTGTVTFAEGQTPLGTVPLDAAGQAQITATLSRGTHTLTVTYSGDPIFFSYGQTSQVDVIALTPTVTAVEPAPLVASTTMNLTIRGSNFENGALVHLSSDVVRSVFVSPTELRVVNYPVLIPYALPSMDVWVEQPRPGSVRSNSFTVAVSPPPPPAHTSLVFGAQSVTAPVSPGALTAWMSLTWQPQASLSDAKTTVLLDDDHDGSVTWQTGSPIPYGEWVAVDLTSGSIIPGLSNTLMPAESTFPAKAFLRDADGHYSHLVLPLSSRVSLLWARPGIGAWSALVEDGNATSDGDLAVNGLIVVEASAFNPVDASPVRPTGFEPGDILVAMGPHDGWFGGRVDDHLAEAVGAGVVSLATGALNASEADGTAKVMLLRREGTDGSATVQYNTADGTATAGVHYVGGSGTVTFGAGEILKPVTVSLINDAYYSGDTTFAIGLSAPAGVSVVNPSTATVTIHDDDPIPVFSIVPPVASMEEGGDGPHTIPVSVKLQGSLRNPVTVTLIWGLGYPSTGYASSKVFAPGEIEKQFEVTYAGNTVPELDRTLSLGLTVADSRVTVSPGGQQIKIIDDDFATVSIADASVSENRGSVSVTVFASRNSLKPLSVTYTTHDGSATAGADYATTTGTVTFTSNQTMQTITVPIQNDSIHEGTERFTLTLTGIQNGKLGRTESTITITDDDPVSFDAPAGLTATANGVALVNVSWQAVPSATSYEVQRRSGTAFSTIGTVSGTSLGDSNVSPNTSYVYRVRAIFGAVSSPYSAVDAATTIVFTDPTLVRGVTVAKAAHIQELRAAVNAMLTVAGLAPFTYADPDLAPGYLISGVHISQLRSELDLARAAIGLPAIAYADPYPFVPNTTMKLSHIEQLRAGVR